ncbi:hypothetical protein CYA_2090 [Synechococcus sp. JA-3-3Ab]|nr:hypothetical protein CYA_2090 [Synechococcus sp. JA-3-3Ab]
MSGWVWVLESVWVSEWVWVSEEASLLYPQENH